jgi:hypothetical protein
MTRTFRAEHKRLRGLLRAEGFDPYRPAARWVSVAERLAMRRRQRAFRGMAVRDIATAWERAMRRVPPDTWASSALLRELEKAR